MRKLTLMKRITDLRDDFIEEAYLSEAVFVPPARHCRAIPVLGIPFALAGKIAASVAGIAVIGVILGIGIPALRDMNPPAVDPPAVSETADGETGAPHEGTEAPSDAEIDVTVTPRFARPGETVEIRIDPSAGTGRAEEYRLYFTYATTPVGADLLAYTAESTDDPSVYTMTIPRNAPVGQYDLHIEWGDRERIIEKPLFVDYAEDYGKNNENVWFSSLQGTFYPVAYVNGGRYVRVDTDEYSDLPWSVVYADGILYMNSSERNLGSLPTLIWNKQITPYYSERVHENRRINVYDEQGEFVKSLPPESIYILNLELERGIYYLSVKGDLWDTDHTEEIKENARNKDALWGDNSTAFQDLFWEEYGKDRLVFVDKHYCEHLLRVIVP